VQLRDRMIQTLRAGGPTESAALAELLSTTDWTAATPDEQRIAAIRAWFARLPGDEARRLALLYPAVVGTLDGAPVEARTRANRIAIAAALHDERRRLAALVADAPADGSFEKLWADANDIVGIVTDIDDDQRALLKARGRIELYERLLHEQIDDPAPRPGSPATVGHQVLLFDPRGDGRIAEMFGPLDDRTRHVAVFVPGTTADLSNSQTYANKMLLLARADLTGGTTSVMWLGMDAPDAVGANAPQPHYADTGGPALRDFVWGVDVPAGADSTVIGHSYGGAVVGTADRVGLDVDRVVLVESPGIGHDVWSAPTGDGRDVQRYTMTAPGDPITYSRVPHWVQDLSGLGHGANPDTTAGYTRLETGRYPVDARHGGELVQGSDAHSGVLTYGSTSWNNIVGVVQGSEVVPWTAPEPVLVDHRPGPHGVAIPIYRETLPYADPAYPGTPAVPVPPAHGTTP
jgi:hypothetical protein